MRTNLLSQFALFIILASASAALTGCASGKGNSSPRLERVREGMDKDEVLDKVGSPKRTFRMNGQDNWVYVFFKKNEEFTQAVVFEDGKVVQVTRASAKQNWGKELENLHQQGGFKNIDGGPEDVHAK